MASFISFAWLFLLMTAVIMMFAAPVFGDCKPNGYLCQPIGGPNNCCSGFCYKQVGWSTGICRDRVTKSPFTTESIDTSEPLTESTPFF